MSGGTRSSFSLAQVAEDVEMDASGFPLSNATPPRIEKPKLDRRLTECSKRYDRSNKGYLDETERAVRELDRNNQGAIEPSHVFGIIERLQFEQSKSNELIESMRAQSKRNAGLRRTVVFLSIFTVLLTVSNIGTSFVAARLARNMEVRGDNLVDMNGHPIATTNHVSRTELTPAATATRRHLEAANDFCKTMSGRKYCRLEGYMTIDKARALHNELLQSRSAFLVCNGAVSELKGGVNVPTVSNTADRTMDLGDGDSYQVFPAIDAYYMASQGLFKPSLYVPGAKTFCEQDYELTMWCDAESCALFGVFDTFQCEGVSPTICGEDKTKD